MTGPNRLTSGQSKSARSSFTFRSSVPRTATLRFSVKLKLAIIGFGLPISGVQSTGTRTLRSQRPLHGWMVIQQPVRTGITERWPTATKVSVHSHCDCRAGSTEPAPSMG